MRAWHATTVILAVALAGLPATASAGVGVGALTGPFAGVGVGALTGPFAGVLEGYDSNTHTYDNNPANLPCVALATTYTLELAYAPRDHDVTLSVGDQRVDGDRGRATLTLERGVCTSFDISVSGPPMMDGQTAYELTVIQDPPVVS